MGAQGEGRRRAGRWQLLVAGGLVGLGVVGGGVGGDGGDAVPRADRLRGLEPALRRWCSVDRDPVLVPARHRRQPHGVGAWGHRHHHPHRPDEHLVAGERRHRRGVGQRRQAAERVERGLRLPTRGHLRCGSHRHRRPGPARPRARLLRSRAAGDDGTTRDGAGHDRAATDRAARDRAADHGAADHRAADRPATAEPPADQRDHRAADRALGPAPDAVHSGRPRQAPPSEAPPRVVTPAPATAVMLPKTGSVTAPTGRVGCDAGGPGPRDAGLRPTVVAERRRGLISSARGGGSAPAHR